MLDNDDEHKIEKILSDMELVLFNNSIPPKPKNILKICYKCAHFEFCWS